MLYFWMINPATLLHWSLGEYVKVCSLFAALHVTSLFSITITLF